VPRGRQIIYSIGFDRGVEALGGYRMVDRALDTIIDGLYRNPHGFGKFENDYISFRYAITTATSDMPSLVVTFTIDGNGDVTLEHIEEYIR
jgi:hypothetical protein